MPVPSPRNKILPARGNYADLVTSVGSILDGEICYAIDQDQYYQKEGTVLVAVGASKAQGLLADTAVQPGDDVSTLNNDAGYITLSEVPADSVASVNAQTGAVVLATSDLANDSGYITSAQAPVQPGDIPTVPTVVSAFTNDAGYITAGDVPADLVTSVQGQTGAVVLTAADLSLGSVDNTSDADKPVSTATQTALDVKADLVDGVIPTSQIPAIAVTEFLGDAADETAMLALSGQKGDWCNRQDVGMSYVITGADPSLLSGWTELVYPAAPVTSVNGQAGTVILDYSDVGAATAVQGAAADSATQPGDDVSTLNNDAGYITLPEVPAAPVQSVNGQTGTVVLDSSDVGAVSASGDNMTGDLTLGTDKVVLDAGTGSATFAGTITSNVTGANYALSLGGNGGLTIGSSGDGALYLKDGTNALETIALSGIDGSATFKSYVQSDRFSTKSALGTNVNGTDYAFAAFDGSSNLYASVGLDGSATFAGSASFAGGGFSIDTSGTISSNINTVGIVKLSSTGSFNDPKITLNSIDGSGTFTGTGIFGGNADNGANAGCRLWSGGAISAARTSGSSATFSSYTVGNSTPQISLYANGSATFTGNITAAGYSLANLTQL